MYDLVVLGGGSGGLNVASAAAAVGAKVALVEKDKLGGECTHTACVPSKALIHAADLAHRIRSADRYGLKVAPPEVDFAAVMDRVRAVVAEFAGSDSGNSLRAKGIDVFRGAPAFEAYDTVIVNDQDRIHGRAFVIATGSRTAVPPIEGLEQAGFITNESFWGLTVRPASLAVIGAGAVGVELAQAMTRLGTEVTIIETNDRILSTEDPEVSDRLRTALESEGIKIFTGVDVLRVEVRDGRKVVDFKNRDDGQTFEAARDEVLVATGRMANIEGLNLEGIGIEVDPQQGIPVDEYLQTYARNIYAIGDVIGHHQWTHAAEREASVVFQNAVLRIPKKVDYAAMPWVTFTDPEVATVGRTHGFEPNEPTRTFRADYDELDRARIEGRTPGFAKVVTTPSGKILGATILGDHAALVLQEFVFAMENRLTLNHIANTVHPYPTHAGLARKLGNMFAATRLEGGFTRAALKLVYGYEPRVGGDSRTARTPAAETSAASTSSNGHGR